MEPITATADAAVSGWTVREIGRPESDDAALALLAHLRPDTVDLARAVAAATRQRVRYLGAYERTGRLVALAGWRVVASTRGAPAVRRGPGDRSVVAWHGRWWGVGRPARA